MGKKAASSNALASRVPLREKAKELGGLFFFLCAMFVLISLVSYNPGDIREIKYPPNQPLLNKGGAIGALVGTAGGMALSAGKPHLKIPAESMLQFQLLADVRIQ